MKTRCYLSTSALVCGLYFSGMCFSASGQATLDDVVDTLAYIAALLEYENSNSDGTFYAADNLATIALDVHDDAEHAIRVTGDILTHGAMDVGITNWSGVEDIELGEVENPESDPVPSNRVWTAEANAVAEFGVDIKEDVEYEKEAADNRIESSRVSLGDYAGEIAKVVRMESITDLIMEFWEMNAPPIYINIVPSNTIVTAGLPDGYKIPAVNLDVSSNFFSGPMWTALHDVVIPLIIGVGTLIGAVRVILAVLKIRLMVADEESGTETHGG